MEINWGALQGGGFQGALAQGLQLGQYARQQKDQRDGRNALAAFVANPSQETAAAIAPYNPELAYKYGQDQRAAAAQQAENGLVQRALGGDSAALDQLATVNFDKWKGLSAEVKAQTKAQSEIYGQAALDLLQVPYAQRRDRVIAYSQRFPEIRQQIEEIAYLPEAEQETALRAVVIEAQMVGKLHDMERPSYQAIPEGGTLVNTRDPAAVQQFGQSGGAVAGYAEGQTATNPQTGQKIVFRNGAWRPM